MTIARSVVLALCVAGLFTAQKQVARAGAFEVIVAQTPPGPTISTSNYGGVLDYHFSDTGTVGSPATGIPAASLVDPTGLVYSNTSGILWVGNRNGNNNAPSSISGFDHTILGSNFTPDGSITGNGLQGVAQLAISPTTGEMFASNGVFNNISRFTLSGATATANGTLSTGTTRGVAISPDGLRLFYTTASNTIHEVNLSTGIELAPITVTGATALHFLRFRGNDLYAADFNSNTPAQSHVFTFSMDAGDNLSASPTDSFVSANAIGIAFSPDQSEMFVSGHENGVISEFLRSGSSWAFAGSIQTPVINGTTAASLGDIIVLPVAVPEPATLGLVGCAAMALVLRRRK